DRMNEVPDLAQALGDSPANAPRFGELRTIADQCQFVTASVGPFRSALSDRVHVQATDAQVRCLAAGVSRDSPEERESVSHGDLVGVPPGALRDRLRKLLAICGVNGAAFEPS